MQNAHKTCSDDNIGHIEKFKVVPALDTMQCILNTIKIWILSRPLNLERKTSDIDQKWILTMP